MAQRKKRRSSRSKKQDEYPGWLWMLFGLAIGLSVAFTVYVKDREPGVQLAENSQKPASLQGSLDQNSEVDVVEPAASEPVAAEPTKNDLTFYDILPAFELIITEDEPDVDVDIEPQAIDEPGIFLLQVGSFSTPNDADRRRAVLASHSIESRIQRARVNNRDYYRVYVGPIDDLDELNITRSRLRTAKIDAIHIQFGD